MSRIVIAIMITTLTISTCAQATSLMGLLQIVVENQKKVEKKELLPILLQSSKDQCKRLYPHSLSSLNRCVHRSAGAAAKWLKMIGKEMQESKDSQDENNGKWVQTELFKAYADCSTRYKDSYTLGLSCSERERESYLSLQKLNNKYGVK